MTKQELDQWRRIATAISAAHGCQADLQVIGFPKQGSSAVSVKIVVTRHLAAGKRLKREVKVRLGDVGAAAAVEGIVRDTADKMAEE